MEPGLELTVDDHPLRPFLIANGYAWAASSYSKNAYDPAQGAKDTHALTQRFNALVGKPGRTYITGASMGGHVTGVVAEQWPKAYDGAMPICGVLGDYELFDYFRLFNVAAQTLSGVGRTFPYGPDYLTTTVPATKAALGPVFPFALNANGLNFKSLVQLRSGGVRPLARCTRAATSSARIRCPSESVRTGWSSNGPSSNRSASSANVER